MRLRLLILFVSVIGASIADAGNIYIDSQVVCQVRPEADPDTVAGSVGGEIIDAIEFTDIYLFSYREPLEVDTVVRMLNENPGVVHAQPNYIVRINLDQVSQPFVDDDQTNQPFVDGVSPARYFEQYAEANLLLDSAHLLNRGEETVVAIIDGGVDNTHPLFTERLDAASFDFVDVDYEPWIYAGLAGDHGTFVAGVAARAAPDASLMIMRCFSASGTGTSITIAHGIYHAARNGADVINMSFGMDHHDGTIADAISAAFLQYGTMLTAAAGNYGEELERFPGSHPYVLNVAAVDSSDIKADFSNYGLTVAATAPGVNIYSSLTGGNVWGWWCGTSFSAPFVSGLAALLRSIYPNSDPGFIGNLISETSDDIDYLNPQYTFMLGTGRVNYLRAASIPGNANGSESVNLGDAVYLVNYVFREGPPPLPPEAGDADCNGQINIGDAVFLVNYTFRGGPAPVRCR
jgi:thermitase